MTQQMTTDSRFQKMTQEPVEKLISSLAVPTIISMMITSIYNMADTFFVSRISTSASGAVGISFSLMAIIQAIGFTFGTGSGNYISRLLGSKNKSYAAKVASTGFFTSLAVGIVLAILGLIFLEPLVYALGATETIAPYAKSYLGYILIGMPYMIASFVLNQILRYQGGAYYAMIGIGVGGLLNIILDPIFIFVLGMGTGGAALATIISQFISFLLLIYNSKMGDNIPIRFKDFAFSLSIFKEVLRNGLPSFYRQAFASTAMISLNFAAGAYGDTAVAGMSIVARLSLFAVSAVLGFGQGFQPVCGFNYGAGLYERVYKSFWFVVKVSAIFLMGMSVLGFLFAPNIIALFRKEDLDVINMGSHALRYQCITLSLSAWIIPVNILLQTIGKSAKSSFISISRQGLFFLPVVSILPRWIGIAGVQLSQPIADFITFFAAMLVTANVLKELKQGHNAVCKPVPHCK